MLLLLTLLMIVLYWEMLSVPYTPSITQVHKRNCTELNDMLDTIGVPKDSPYRKQCVGQLSDCPVGLRPSPGPNDTQICPGSSKLTTSKNGNPCCFVPPSLTDPDSDSMGKEALDFLKNNKIIAAQIMHTLMEKFLNYLTKKNVSNPKRFLESKMSQLKSSLQDYVDKQAEARSSEDGGADGDGDVGDTDPASGDTDPASGDTASGDVQATDQAVDQSVDQAVDKAVDQSVDQAVDKAVDQSVDQAVDKAADEAAGKAAEKGAGEVLSKILSRIVGEAVEMCFAEIAARVALAVMEFASGVGSVVGALMMVGMALDVVDVGAYRQFMDNQYTYAAMRNSVDGALTVKLKQVGVNMPLYFNLDSLGNKVVSIQDETKGDGLIFKDIHQSYSEAKSIHHTMVMKQALTSLDSDDSSLNDMFEKIINGEGKVNVTDTLKNKFKDLFHDNAVDRDKYIYKYLQNHLFTKHPEYKKYIMVDYDMSDADISGITLSEKGIAKWNQFVIDNHHATHVPRVIYSKYYRDIPDITDQKYVRDGIENDPSTLNSKGDLRGTKVYNLVTYKIKDKKGVEKKWPQSSYSANILKTKCERGMHLPSTAYLLANAADKKLCEFQTDSTCKGTADKDGNACQLNDNKSNCMSTNDDGTPTGDCVFEGWIPSQCIIDGQPSSEYAMNKLECQYNNGTYYPSQCGTRKSSFIDGHTSNYSQGILQKSTCSDLNSANCKQFAAKSLAVGAAAGVIAPVAATYEVLDVAGDTDVKPEDYKVTYDEDTGVCKMTQEWCKRMEIDYFEEKGHAGLVHPEQTFTNCTESELQEDLEMILGKNIVRIFRLAGEAIDDCDPLPLLLFEKDKREKCEGDIISAGDMLGDFIESEAKNVEQVGKDLVHDVEDVTEDVGDAISHGWSKFKSLF